MSEAGESPQEFDLPLAKLAVASAPAGFDDETPFEEGPPQSTLEMPDGGEDLAVALRRTLGMFATGVTVITTRHGEQLHGMTAVSAAGPIHARGRIQARSSATRSGR